MSPMSPKEKIAKLERLLARVKERTEAPRRTGAAPIPAPPAHSVHPAAHAAAEPEAAHVASEAEAAHTAQPVDAFPSASSVASTREIAPRTLEELPSAAFASAPPTELSTGWSEAPAGVEAAPETAADPVADMGEDDMEVEVSAEVVELDIDIDEPGMMPAESGAQPVADHVADHVTNGAAEHEPDLDDVAALVSAPPVAPEAEAEPDPEPEPVVPANEVVEPAPSSSPRPIATEQPDAYEEESAPRHTPPPESGKQVAAPSVKPEPASRKSSMPPAESMSPPSLEGHTLIGGWREPGMALPRDPSEVSRGPAVRVPPPPPPPPPADVFGSQARPTASVPPRAGEASGFGPVVAKPELPESAQVATIEGAAPPLAPATFGELLDATLSI